MNGIYVYVCQSRNCEVSIGFEVFDHETEDSSDFELFYIYMKGNYIERKFSGILCFRQQLSRRVGVRSSAMSQFLCQRDNF